MQPSFDEAHKFGKVFLLLPINAHSQMTPTRHPIAINFSVTAASRTLFLDILSRQKSTFDFGIMAVMPMPETPIYKESSRIHWENQIRFAKELFNVHPVSVSSNVGLLADLYKSITCNALNL